jgi:hypothetical protein
MDVNKIKILNTNGDKEIVVPISTNWDLVNREDAIKDEEKKIIKQIIGTPPNYELQRFSRKVVDNSTAQEYQFNFFNTGTTIWEPSYLNRFSESLIRYTRGGFAKSFFKLDLYDSKDPKKQKIYLSIILPTSRSSELSSTGTFNCQGYNFFKVESTINFLGYVNFIDCCGIQQSLLVTPLVYGCVDESFPVTFSGSVINSGPPETLIPQIGPVYLHGEGTNTFIGAANLSICECIPEVPPPAEPPNLTFPNFYLDHVGNQEGYYIYWYQDKNLINLSELYMTAKFFDASIGTFTRFTTTPQTQTKIPNNDLYYRVILDYTNKLYKITNLTDLVPVVQANWYEYVNPKIV